MVYNFQICWHHSLDELSIVQSVVQQAFSEKTVIKIERRREKK